MRYKWGSRKIECPFCKEVFNVEEMEKRIHDMTSSGYITEDLVFICPICDSVTYKRTFIDLEEE